MSKIKVSDLKCFDQVADVIGKAKAQVELFKALSKECHFTDEERLIDAFIWMRAPQGSRFWREIYEGTDPYGKN